MQVFGGIILFSSLGVLIFGLINPQFVLPGLESPTRLKAFGVAFALFWIGGLIIGATAPENKKVSAAADNSQESGQTTEQPAPIEPPQIQRAEMALKALGTPYGFVVAGRTNLPFGTQMVVSLERTNGTPLAEGDANVGEFGRFYAGPFTRDQAVYFKAGRYIVNVTAALADIQPPEVKQKAGANWSLFSGPLIKSDAFATVPTIDWKLNWKPPDGNPSYETSASFPSSSSMQRPDTQWVLAAIGDRVQARQAEWDARRADAFSACKDFILQNLRDPDSAEFLSEYAPELVDHEGEAGYRVLMRIRAANGFGGKNLSVMSCSTHLSDGQWHLDGMNEIQN